MVWSATAGGDYGGGDWTPANGLDIAGTHTNIGTFTVSSGYTINIKAYDGSNYGSAEITANNISILGTINGNYRGYRGGKGGKGSNGIAGSGYNTSASTAGTVGEADSTARDATGGIAAPGVSYGTSDPDYLLHRNHVGGTGGSGSHGGYYKANGGNGDTSTTETIYMGAGGGGGAGGGSGGGYGTNVNVSGGGGGGGGAGSEGGASLKLEGYQTLILSGIVNMRGGNNIAGNGAAAVAPSSRHSGSTAGAGGSITAAGSSSGGSYANGIAGDGTTSDAGIRGGSGGAGGDGAGGGVLIKCYDSDGWTLSGGTINVSSVGSGGDGTVKVFYTDTDHSGDLTITSGVTTAVAFDAETDPPTNLLAAKGGVADTIELSWTDNTASKLSWYVERRLNEGAWSVLVSGQAAATVTYTDSTASGTGNYYYRVRGYHTTYLIYTDYTYGAGVGSGGTSGVDTTADTKMIGLAGKHLWGLDTNYLSGTWQTLQNYNLGTVQTTISGTTCIVNGTVVTGTTSFWGTESQVSTGDVMFLPNVSGTSSDIIYDAPYPITVISGTKIVISGCSLTLATASDYTIATTLAVGDTIDFLQYDLNLFMAKIGDYPLRYDNVGVKPVGCAVPSTACTAAEAASGNLDDSAVYYWKITYVYGDYGESNGSAASTIVTTTGASKKGALTAIPIGGQFVTARNIYRTEGGGSDYYYVGALADNTTTTYSDTSSDATIVAIGTSIPTTHDVPTKLGCIGEKFSRLYGGKNSIYPYRLFYTDATKPYAWDAANYVDRDGKGKIMKIVDAFEALVIFYERGIEMADVSNATPSNWVFITVPTSVGLAATQGFDITNNGIYFLGINNGMPEVHILHRGEQSVVNATFDNITPDSLSEKIDTFMSNINLNSIGISKLKVFDNKIYLSVAYGDSSILNRLAIYDIRRDAWSIHTTNYQSFEIYSNKLLAGSPNDNYCHEIETGYTDSSSNPVSFTWKSKQFNADRPDLDKQFQLIRIRGEADSGIINIAWSCDYNKTTGNFSYDLSEDGNEFIRYFPDSAMGRVIQLTVSCTNSVATKIIDIVMNFQIYELGS